MKPLLAILLASILPLAAEQVRHFPDKAASISITVSETWHFQKSDRNELFAQSIDPRDEYADLLLLPLIAKIQDAALKEARAALATDFSDLNFSDPTESATEALEAILLTATGVDPDGATAQITFAVFHLKDTDTHFMLCLACGEQEAARHKLTLQNLLKTITARSVVFQNDTRH